MITIVSDFRALSFPAVCRGLSAFLYLFSLLICLLFSPIQPGILLLFRPKDKQEKLDFFPLPLVYTDDTHGCITAPASLKMVFLFFSAGRHLLCQQFSVSMKSNSCTALTR